MLMQEFNLLAGYPASGAPRYVGPGVRTIVNKITASYRDKRYYDGTRSDGYGGFNYDGRWQPIARLVIDRYHLTNTSSILQIGPEKGFLLHDLSELNPKVKLTGYENSEYAIDNAMPSIKNQMIHGRYEKLPFEDQAFDLVIAIGVVYTLNLADAMACLKEIERVGKGKSFITLGAFYDEESERKFRWWSLLGSTILHTDDWISVLNHIGYRGDYSFVTSKSLNLVEYPVDGE